MHYITVRDLRTTPGQVWEALSAEGELVLTNNGRPQALMIEVDGESLEATRAAVQQARLMRLVAQQQAASVAAGLDRLTDEDIEAEIAAVRRTRRGS